MSIVLTPPQKRRKQKPLNSFVPSPYCVKRWTVEEYRRMADAGLLTTDDRVELLEGWIVPKMTQHPPHAWALQNAVDILKPCLEADCHTRSQFPIEARDSEPEPDLSVVQGPIDRYLHRHPRAGEIALVIEVADSSGQKDRRKARIYASIGVPAYWIINLVDRQVEAYSLPLPDKKQYQERRILTPGDRLAFRVEDRVLGEFTVDQFLPPIEPTA